MVFGQLAAFAIWLIHPLSSGLRNWAEKRFPPKKESLVDIDGDGTPDYAIPPGPFVYYLKGLIAPITVVLLVQLIWAAVFCELEGWDYGSAVYHCFITATTVGFGDVTIVTDGGKMWAFFHIFLSVALMATVITDVGELRSKRAQLLKRMLLMKASLDLEMMKSLDKDGKGVDRVEFVVGMMERLGLAEWQDAVPFNKLFEELDADGSGKLDEKDMERAREKLESKNRKMESNLVQARMRNKSQHHRDAAPSSPTSTKGSHPSLPGVAAVQSSVPAALDGGVIEVPTIEVTVEKA